MLKMRDPVRDPVRDPSVQKCMKTLGMTSLNKVELKRAFRTKAMQLHPDKGGSVKAMQEVNGAFRFLLTVADFPEDASLSDARREIMRRFHRDMAVIDRASSPMI